MRVPGFRSLLAAAALVAAIFCCAPAFAQGAVQAYQPQTYGHAAMFGPQTNYLMDAGGPTANGLAPQNTANPGASPLGYQWVNSGLGECGFSAYANTAFSTMCWGFDGSGNGLITLSNSIGTAQSFGIRIGTTTYPFPGPGSGDVLGPSGPVGSGDFAVFNGTNPLLLADGGAVGTASHANTGTSGATLGLLNANKTDSGNNIFSGSNTFSGTTTASGPAYFTNGRPWCDVMGAGALGNGSTIDRSAFQNCINIIAALGAGEVYVPPASVTYRIDGGITILPYVNLTCPSFGVYVQDGPMGNTAPAVSMVGPYSEWHECGILGFYGTTAAWAALDITNSCGCIVDHVRTYYGLGVTNEGPESIGHYIVPSSSFGPSQFYNGNNFPAWNNAYRTANAGLTAGGYFDQLLDDTQFPNNNTGVVLATLAGQNGYANWAANTNYTAVSSLVLCCSPSYSWVLQAQTSGESAATAPTVLPYGKNFTDGSMSWQLVGSSSCMEMQLDSGTDQFYVNEGDFTGACINSVELTNSLVWGPYTSAATPPGLSVLHFTSVPSYIVAGLIASDVTSGNTGAISPGTTVLSTTPTTVTLNANVASEVFSGDEINFVGGSPTDFICQTCTIAPYLGYGIFAGAGAHVYLSGRAQLSGGVFENSTGLFINPTFIGILQYDYGNISSGCLGGIYNDGGVDNKFGHLDISAAAYPTACNHAIGFQSSAAHFSLTDVTPYTPYGIDLVSGADWGVITGNDLSNTVTPLSNSSLGLHNIIENNPGYNPVGVTAAAVVGTSPATLPASPNPSPVTLYIAQSATNTATIKSGAASAGSCGGSTLATLSTASTVPVSLGPNEQVCITWATTEPTYAYSVH